MITNRSTLYAPSAAGEISVFIAADERRQFNWLIIARTLCINESRLSATTTGWQQQQQQQPPRRDECVGAPRPWRARRVRMLLIWSDKIAGVTPGVWALDADASAAATSATSITDQRRPRRVLMSIRAPSLSSRVCFCIRQNYEISNVSQE